MGGAEEALSPQDQREIVKCQPEPLFPISPGQVRITTTGITTTTSSAHTYIVLF